MSQVVFGVLAVVASPCLVYHVTAAIPIEPDLLSDIEESAHLRGIKVETLVNLWLKEKVVETKAG